MRVWLATRVTLRPSRSLGGDRPGHARPRSAVAPQLTLEKPRAPARRCGPVPVTYPATPVVSWRGNWGGVPVFLEAQIGHLGELIVPLVTARGPGLSIFMLVVPPPWSCA